ncbi:phosphotransferase [Bacillus sp. FJAT-50079]|uniref:phosphotransferase n=1 Tax=Bacillus sp. FJAT-50079 TaxID=2833577 RepID=UPI001BC9CD8B|nr:phosphotransferase [Bacillus sp. FJAT-50079]MBS4209145.1 hypothetical protein [Bacillus sp. FJAT-50079]
MKKGKGDNLDCQNTRVYNYILIENNIYINVAQSIIGLHFYLFNNGKPFTFLERTTRSQLINRLPSILIRFVRVSQFTYAFYVEKRKYKNKVPLSLITTNHYGQCLLKLRQGEYKVFNLKEQKVKTILPDYISFLEAENRISSTKEISQYEFAPDLINWSVKERYLTEEYINFNRPSYNFSSIEKVYMEIFPIIKKIMTVKNTQTLEYKKFMQERVENLSKVFQKMNCHKSRCADEIAKIRDFCDNVIKILENNQSDTTITLVFSHGDFWEGNILTKNGDTRVIDWNTHKHRSCYFDFYFMLFMLTTKNSHMDKINQLGLIKLSRVMDSLFENFYNSLTKSGFFNQDLLSSLKNSNIYRYLFYMELIILKFPENNITIEQINEVNTWVKRFKLYEATVKKNGK